MDFDKEAFIKEKNAAIETEYQRSLDITPNPNNPGFSLSGKSLPSELEETANFENGDSPEAEDTTTTVNQEQWYTSRIIEPNGEDQMTEYVKAKDEPPMTTSELTESITPTPIDESSEENDTHKSQEEQVASPASESNSDPHPEAVEQSKKTRRSSKMVELDFDTLAAQFICQADVGEKKPLFFPEKIRESLRKISGLVPGGKVSPSHIAIHVIEAWIDEHRDLFNRMFANQKTSI